MKSGSRQLSERTVARARKHGKKSTKARTSERTPLLKPLPFCRDRPGKGNGWDCWSIKETGDPFTDDVVGNALAQALIQQVARVDGRDDLPQALNLIVNEMIRKGVDYSPSVRVGFLNYVGKYLANRI